MLTQAPTPIVARPREKYLKFEAWPKTGSFPAVFAGVLAHPKYTKKNQKTGAFEEKENGVTLIFATQFNGDWYFVKSGPGANSTHEKSNTQKVFTACMGEPLDSSRSVGEAVGKPVMVTVANKDKVGRQGKPYTKTHLESCPVALMENVDHPDPKEAMEVCDAEVTNQLADDTDEENPF